MFGKLLRTVSLIVLAMAPLSNVSYGQDGVQYENLDQALSVQWEDLMSPADLEAILNAPPLSHDQYGWQDQLGSDPAEEAYMQAMQSFDVNPEVLNRRILIPGFIVPTAYNAARRVTEFFLVPFFGACIHVPPPPPNQIIHVTFEPGVQLGNLYDPYIVLGELTGKVVRNELANSAYSLKAEGVEIYDF
jgi:hypothetical protein